MPEPTSLDPTAHRPCASERSAWLAAAASQQFGEERPCERSRPSAPSRRQRNSADSAAGDFVDPWRGC